LWGCCAVTEVDDTALLVASHIKPWRDCSNSERLDPYNGFLLLPHLDHLFDKGFISFEDSGEILISSALSSAAKEKMHIDEELAVEGLHLDHRPFLSLPSTVKMYFFGSVQ
jgi:predicted restriction endonuclease